TPGRDRSIRGGNELRTGSRRVVLLFHHKGRSRRGGCQKILEPFSRDVPAERGRISPSPLVGEGRGGGLRSQSLRACTPTPTLPHKATLFTRARREKLIYAQKTKQF